MKLIFNVRGMKCEGCENRIKNVASDIEGVNKVLADYKTGLVTVFCNKDLKSEIISVIEELGFEVVKWKK